MYSKVELRKVLDNWNLEDNLPIGDISLMDGAKVSENVWTIGNNYYLKCGSREKIIKNLKISKALANQGFTSALPVLTKTGEEYVEDKDLFILTYGLKGNPLSSSEQFGSNRVMNAKQFGTSLAKLHKALKSIQQEILADEVNLYKNVTEWALPIIKKQNKQWDMGLDESFFSDYIQVFGSLYDKLPRQLIHRDPHPGNILFDQGTVSGFIDFDISEINIRLWDVCYCATGMLSIGNEEAYRNWLDILRGILLSYDLECPLTKEEKEAVYYVICSIQMIFIAFFDNQDIYKELANTNRHILKYIAQNKEKIESIFK